MARHGAQRGAAQVRYVCCYCVTHDAVRAADCTHCIAWQVGMICLHTAGCLYGRCSTTRHVTGSHLRGLGMLHTTLSMMHTRMDHSGNICCRAPVLLLPFSHVAPPHNTQLHFHTISCCRCSTCRRALDAVVPCCAPVVVRLCVCYRG
jgi:hypothetical protein